MDLRVPVSCRVFKIGMCQFREGLVLQTKKRILTSPPTDATQKEERQKEGQGW